MYIVFVVFLAQWKKEKKNKIRQNRTATKRPKKKCHSRTCFRWECRYFYWRPLGYFLRLVVRRLFLPLTQRCLPIRLWAAGYLWATFKGSANGDQETQVCHHTLFDSLFREHAAWKQPHCVTEQGSSSFFFLHFVRKVHKWALSSRVWHNVWIADISNSQQSPCYWFINHLFQSNWSLGIAPKCMCQDFDTSSSNSPLAFLGN